MAKWAVDPSHTTIGFSVRHMMITNVRGEFASVKGSADFDPQSPAGAKVEGSVDVASINTREAKRDAHLKSADFFDAETHPTLSFTSKGVESKGGKLEVYGDITIRGTTKPITLHVDEVTGENKDPWGNTRIGVTAHASLSRKEFGLTWNQALETGGMLVGDEVKLTFDVSFVKQA